MKRSPGITFSKQTGRKNVHNCVGHEKRFIVSNLTPSVCSKYRQSGSPDFSRSTAREKVIKRKLEFDRNYNPNKEILLPKLATSIRFDRMTKRRGIPSENWYCPEGYNVKYTVLDKNIRAIDLAKQVPRSPEKINRLAPVMMYLV